MPEYQWQWPQTGTATSLRGAKVRKLEDGRRSAPPPAENDTRGRFWTCETFDYMHEEFDDMIDYLEDQISDKGRLTCTMRPEVQRLLTIHSSAEGQEDSKQRELVPDVVPQKELDC